VWEIDSFFCVFWWRMEKEELFVLKKPGNIFSLGREKMGFFVLS
jgi:hypothetical protein